jgi:signal transduction histidine kinase
MPDPWDEVVEPGARRERRPRRQRRQRQRVVLTREQRLYREARRRASLKLSFVTHFIVYAAVCFLILSVAGFRPAFYAALGWGIAIVVHYFSAVVAPDLHRRFVEREVKHEVERSVSAERRTLQDKHAQSLEQLSASIAHEIRNPITAAKSLVQQMGEDPAAEQNVDYAHVALEELDRVERSISHLLRFARDEELSIREMDLLEVVDSALESFRDRIGRLGVSVGRDVATDGAIRGDAEKLRRVIINLVGNALDALEQAQTPEPRIEVIAGENLAGTEVWMRIRDNGPGIEPEMLQKIFSPFYTSKANGTGLGLAISKKVVDAHGGSLEVSSAPGAGAEFLLTFPKANGAETAEA